ncbi:DNA polymerase [Aerococcaceae bacterium zg-BR33]|nr:DNA polymerase [Aerococcaceae bacterium zg-BR22]MBS4456143.1 DNA polymerase [Aerococcaceae bacterium zg-A91]MBS4457994.1 DNA polymerase [Aerococcaceae bacterium zg-BR33]
MGLYIERNLQIQSVLENFAPRDEILPYSIDEGFIDLTRSLDYFERNLDESRRERLDKLSRKIQIAIWNATGIYSTVGMSNANPLLAKLALDNEAKKNATMRANWSYEDVESKVWNIKQMTDFWGIGKRTEARLNKLKIYSIRDLANANPDVLQHHLGVIGLQLWFHANGVDESNVLEPYRPKAKGLGNSQILPKNYYRQKDIEVVLAEMAEQVAIRIRRIHKKTTNVAIYIGYADKEKSLRAQITIDPTQQTKVLVNHVLTLFRKHYNGHGVRSIGIRYAGLIDEQYTYYTLWDDPDEIERTERLERTIDTIRQRFGGLAVQKATSLLENSRVRTRSQLIGGHSAGGLDGLN